MVSKKVALIKGDGVGPELAKGLTDLLDAVGSDVEMIPCDAGSTWWEANGGSTLIPNETWDILDEADAAFKSPTTTPGGIGSPKSVAVSIRQKYNLYANVRPIKTYENTNRPLGDVDFVCVREGTEGLYFGSEVVIDENVSIAIRKVTKKASQNIARYAFEEAKKRNWDTVVAIHKSNILKETCGRFINEVEALGELYPGIDIWTYHIDNMAQQLIKNPQLFNRKILLSTNLFMDVISEECSALVGSIGLISSANIGDEYAMFEPAHGSAPKYAGLDKVNPTATLLAGAWMLEYLNEADKGNAIKMAITEVITEGKVVTYDLGGDAKMSEMVKAVIDKVA